jgi:DNA-binding MarR family transcriptional regulator
VSRHTDPTHKILEEIASSPEVSQRSLSATLGIALGLTNSLLKGLVRRGWVRVSRVKRQRVRYLLTPAGLAEKARLSQHAFHSAVDRYRTARVHVHDMFERVSAEWTEGAPAKPVVFYGSGELAEIGYICLQETDLTLVAVIDTVGRGQFFGVPVFDRSRAEEALVHAGPGARLLVVSGSRTEVLDREVADLGMLGDQAVWFD